MPTSTSPLAGALLLVLLAGCLGNTLDGASPSTASSTDDTVAGDAAGAAAQNPTPSTPVQPVYPFEALAPATAASKIKRLIARTPCTQAEAAQIGADPNALGELVDTWMASPAYADTMQRFFADAFEQSQVTAPMFEGTVYNGGAVPEQALVQNMRESFARTVMALIGQGRPFTEAVTTRQLMMTTKLMAYYAYVDASLKDDAGRLKNRWYELDPNWRFTLQKSRGAIPLEQADDPKSSNYLTFYDPSLGEGYYTNNVPQTDEDAAVIAKCATLDPLAFGDPQIFARIGNGVALLYGIMHKRGFSYFHPREYQPDTILCNKRSTGTTYFQDSDYTDWRLVTLNPAGSAARETTFINLPGLRRATTMNLYQPVVGYMTTPSFLAQWSTNKSNSARAIVNQTLIVGLGGAVGDDKLVPLSVQPAVDADHSANPACYSCHQNLDPLRQFFRQSLSLTFSEQRDSRVQAVPAMFAFDGVTRAGTGLPDLAQAIATHPSFARAWVQKVCTWANGTPCLESDPHLVAIARDFAQNNFNWPQMVRAVLLSPPVTYLSDSVTVQVQGQSAVLARRNQICGLLADALGLGEVCARDTAASSASYSVPALASTLPSDQYGRGVVAPLYVTRPDMILRTTMENMCSILAGQLSKSRPSVPLASSDPNVALPALVHDLMGIEAGRDEQPLALLRQHYADVLAAKQTSDVAWQSSFVVACSSPFVAGTGQ